jgi:hypothetical protein
LFIAASLLVPTRIYEKGNEQKENTPEKVGGGAAAAAAAYFMCKFMHSLVVF